MSKIHVIGISGWKRSGKDTAADILVKDHNFMRVSFADPLKELVAKEYNIPLEHCYSDEHKEAPILSMPVTPKDSFTKTVSKLLVNEFKDENGMTLKELEEEFPGKNVAVPLYWTPRALCILKGSTNRAVDPNFWTNQAIKYIKGHANSVEKIQERSKRHQVDIQDINYVISDLRYVNEAEQMKEAFNNGPFKFTSIRVNRFDSVDTNDPSERNLDDYKFDVVIENKSTIEDFERKVQSVIEEIKNA